jgi:hypothetical protein
LHLNAIVVNIPIPKKKTIFKPFQYHLNQQTEIIKCLHGKVSDVVSIFQYPRQAHPVELNDHPFLRKYHLNQTPPQTWMSQPLANALFVIVICQRGPIMWQQCVAIYFVSNAC